MVSYSQIQASNALITDATAPRIAAFVGGTSGIGKSTVRALVATGATARIYLIGRRSSKERMDIFIQELHAINPNAEVVWTEGEVSLLAETRRICDDIQRKESRVDLLFLSAGYPPFGARKETIEGLEIAQSLEYYSRILFVLRLLPILREAEAPRVVSVLAGGLERANLNLDDIDLKGPGNFSGMKAQTQYSGMKTTILEKLASENPGITFIHSSPGAVNTGNVRRGLDPGSVMAWLVWLILEPLVSLFAYSDEECGQRHLFQSTSAVYGGRGIPWTGKTGINSLGEQSNGLFLVSHKCDCTPNTKATDLLRQNAQARVWEHERFYNHTCEPEIGPPRGRAMFQRSAFRLQYNI